MISPTTDHVCSHCGISFRWKPIYLAESDKQTEKFCCHGCKGAYQLICNAGLTEFYCRSNRTSPTVAAAKSQFTTQELVQSVVPEGNLCRMDILIGGISCPSCIWLLDLMIKRVEGVKDVSISYTAGIAAVRFDPQLTEPSAIFTVITSLGYTPRPYSRSLSEASAKAEKNDLLIRFGTALFLVMQLMAYSYSLYAGYFQGMAPAMKDFLQYVSMAVATPVVFYCGWPFLSGAWRSVVARRPGMDLLITIGALSSWSYSVWATFTRQETYFESSAMIITFVLCGRLLELSVKHRAMSGIEALYGAVPHHALILDKDCQREVEVGALLPGNIIMVRQGDTFPVDCLIIDGETEVDQALVTGESKPVVMKAGDEVRAGSVNNCAPVSAQVMRPLGQSYIMRVAALVQMAQAGKPALQRLADTVAAWFVPAVLILALLVFGYGFIQGHSNVDNLMRALAVVLIACPCAMGLAVPTAVLAGCSRSASLGIILRGGDVLERLASIGHVCFDKTGTITRGAPSVVSATSFPPYSLEEALAAATTIEQQTSHPLAEALRCYAAELGIIPESTNNIITNHPGKGICGIMADGTEVLCGNERLLHEQGIKIVPKPLTLEDATNVWVAINGTTAASLQLQDNFRKGSRELITYLKRYGIETHLISGDNEPLVQNMGLQIGITDAQGGMLPDDKMSMIVAFQNNGEKVLMVGDGVNDAPSLAAAHVSCSLIGSSDIALENADIIITGEDLYRLSTAHNIARKTMTVIKQNLAWAFIYNLIGIPLAMNGSLTPLYASVAMVASSLLVSLNSLRLMRFKVSMKI